MAINNVYSIYLTNQCLDANAGIFKIKDIYNIHKIMNIYIYIHIQNNKIFIREENIFRDKVINIFFSKLRISALFPTYISYKLIFLILIKKIYIYQILSYIYQIKLIIPNISYYLVFYWMICVAIIGCTFEHESFDFLIEPFDRRTHWRPHWFHWDIHRTCFCTQAKLIVWKDKKRDISFN